jgi:hypothetical protein
VNRFTQNARVEKTRLVDAARTSFPDR